MLHIAFIVSHYPHQAFKQPGGLGTSVFNLVNALTKKGVKTSVFVYGQSKSFVINEGSQTIYSIKQNTSKFLGWYTYRKHLNSFINSIINEEKIDVIEAPDWTGITAFMTFKIPLVIRFHGSDAYFCKLDKRQQKFKNFLFEKMAIKKATAFITPTTYAGEVTSKIFSIKPSKIKTIHYGLQLKDFINANPSVYTPNTILYIGALIRKKGVLELAQIFNTIVEKHPEAQLILIGGDAPDLKTGNASTYNEMERLFTKKAKANHNYLGKIPYWEVQKHIKQAHVCTFPSFAETLGMVTIESMALQKPVVNTSIGWAKELIDNGVNGYLVHPTKIEDYATRILELLNNKQLCLTIGKAARLKVDTLFDIEKNADINIAYYKSIIK